MTDNKDRQHQSKPLDEAHPSNTELDQNSNQGKGVSEKQQTKKGLKLGRGLGLLTNEQTNHHEKPQRETLIRSDLKSALDHAMNSWDRLTKEVDGKPAPDQQQLNEVKRLLGELKNKIDQF